MTGWVIRAVGACSPVGDGAAQTAASIRAGLSGLSRHPVLVAQLHPHDMRDDQTLQLAAAPHIDPHAQGLPRLIALAASAIAEVCEAGGLLRNDLATTALFVALPASDAVTDTWSLDGFADALCRRCAVRFAHVAVQRGGHTAGFRLLGLLAGLHPDRIRRCVVLAVDSLASADRLVWLDGARRVRTRRTPDGLIPGEAAAAVMFERVTPGADDAGTAIVGMGECTEANTVGSGRRSTGRALSEALRRAWNIARERESARWALCDLNGESYRSSEWGIVSARCSDEIGRLERLVTTAEAVGDVGAATGTLLLALAHHAWKRGYAPPGDALLCSGADDGHRAAVRIRHHHERGSSTCRPP